MPSEAPLSRITSEAGSNPSLHPFDKLKTPQAQGPGGRDRRRHVNGSRLHSVLVRNGSVRGGGAKDFSPLRDTRQTELEEEGVSPTGFEPVPLA